ncbi:MAG: methyltransferase domain-containing protein [Vicinamibacterales bacterium]
MGSGVATYYERLGRWNRIARAVGYGGGASTLTVHRALVDPRANGRVTFTRLHDLLLEQIGAGVAAPRVLDAGCGLGGTMLVLAESLDATCVGLTLSPSQAATANTEAARRQLVSRVRADVRSYDAPPAGPFDLVVAIESLAHSLDPARSVAALAATLAPGGRLIVVDDMPEPGAALSPDLTAFMRGWQCPVLWPAAAYVEGFQRAGLAVDAHIDLTAQCRPRAHGRLALLMACNRLVRRWPSDAFRQVMDSHYGGLALERLIRDGLVHYRLLVARRPELQVS